MKRWLFPRIVFALTACGCVGTQVPHNDIYYTNDTVYYVSSPQEAHPAVLNGVTHIRLDREYVTVETRNGTHIFPRDRFIQSSPDTSAMPATMP